METTVKDRLKIYLSYKGIRQSKFSEAVGLSKAFVNNIVNSIQPSTLDRIAKQFPDLSKSWLLTGEGEMLNTSSVSQRVENSNHVSLYGDANSYSEENINKFLEELASQRKALEKSQEQLSVAQEQINRLITLLEKRQ
jgi:transcriptional regulator with XRE-family HTH domain